MRTNALAITAAALAAALLAGPLAGCTADVPGPGPSSSASAPSEASLVTVADAWVKAADGGMTAGFGVLTNAGATPAVVTSAESAAAPALQLHETVADGSGGMSMQPAAGGLVVPAGGSLALEPGGYHIMFMGLASPLRPGDEVTITLTFEDGSTLPVTAIVKPFSGANEDYQG